jgi:3-hydroxy-3-methylglutaryl CoA synthase/uncharacterized OB-fold protein
MAGIISFGAYIPFWRLNREVISPGLKGEKAIANFDEDSLTLGVASSINCLKDIPRDMIEALFFACTTAPYLEKEAASIMAAALDLRPGIRTADYGNSLRAGTNALLSAVDAIKAGAASQVLVAASDCRLASPGSELEPSLGDGAASILVGQSNDIVASIEASYSSWNVLFDIWRPCNELFLRSWEARFRREAGYERVINRALIDEFLGRANLTAKDISKVIFAIPDPKTVTALAKMSGFDPKTQVQDLMYGNLGDAGTAYPFILLVATLEEANPGDNILLISYGDGSSIILLRVTEKIIDLRAKKDRKSIKGYLASKQVLNDYCTYLRWRKILNPEAKVLPMDMGMLSIPASWREWQKNLSLCGSRCRVCSTIQYPPQRICAKCHAKDQSESVRLSDKKAKIVAYSTDPISSPLDKPLITTTIDFDGGGRMENCFLTDHIPEQVKVGLPLEMSFRKLFFDEGIHNYFWKAVPLRE